jgi:hypothetical protein
LNFNTPQLCCGVVYSESIELIREVDDILKRLAGRKEKQGSLSALMISGKKDRNASQRER